MGRWAAGAGLLLLMAVPATASAQGRTCDLVEPTDFRRITNSLGDEIVYFSGPVRLRCEGGIRLDSDSAVYNRGQLQIELIGQVLYRDSTRQLTSDWANYLSQVEVLIARGDVVVTDLVDGSTVTGQEMEYQRESPERPVSRVVMRGGRPRAVLREGRDRGPESRVDPTVDPLADPIVDPMADSRADPAADPAADTVPPVEITADRLESVGDSLFRAMGAVDLVRGDMTGASDSATYRRVSAHLSLFGSAHVRDEQFRLEGERLDAVLAAEELDEVTAADSARLLSDDLTVRAPRLRIGFVDGEVDRMEAWNPAARAVAAALAAEAMAADTLPEDTTGVPEPPEAAPDLAPDLADDLDTPDLAPLRDVMAEGMAGAAAERAVATADRFQLRADSIDARAELGQLRELRAVGRAYGERPLDAAPAGLPAVVARDWTQGDTIIGYFRSDTSATDAAATEPAVTDTAATEPAATDTAEMIMERLVVIGGSEPALSLYRMEQEPGQGRAAINFMRARRITLHLTDGDVSLVEAEGPLEGLHLDPVTGAPEGDQPGDDTEGDPS